MPGMQEEAAEKIDAGLRAALAGYDGALRVSQVRGLFASLPADKP